MSKGKWKKIKLERALIRIEEQKINEEHLKTILGTEYEDQMI